jgi:hypothetical protein
MNLWDDCCNDFGSGDGGSSGGVMQLRLVLRRGKVSFTMGPFIVVPLSAYSLTLD